MMSISSHTYNQNDSTRQFSQWNMYFHDEVAEISGADFVDLGFQAIFGEIPVLDFAPTMQLFTTFKEHFLVNSFVENVTA